MDGRKAQLEAILASPVQQDAFVVFCKKKHCAENILFYRGIVEFEGMETDAERLTQAHVLLGQFIKPQSPLEVNMPDTLRAEMADGVASGVVPPDALKKLKEAAFLDMMRDTMPRFLKDELYTEACLAESSDLVHRLRKKKVLGFKVKQRHSKSDIKAFAALGSTIRKKATKEGFLMKRGNNHQSWKRRWCVLSPIGLAYFLDEYRFGPKGVILAHEMTGVKDDMDAEVSLKFTLGVITEARTYVIQAANNRDRRRWVEALTTFIDNPAMEAVGGSGDVAAAAPGSDGH